MKKVFLDTSIFVSGLLDPSPDPACRSIIEALKARRLRSCVTARHCCLEFFSVMTRLPPEYRLSAEAAVALLEEHVFDRVSVCDLPVDVATVWMRGLGGSDIVGGLVYDAHLAQVAASSRCGVLVTGNLKNFRQVAPHGIEVLSAQQFVDRIL